MNATTDLPWDEMHRAHTPRLRNVVRRYLRNPNEIDDAVQQIWLKAWRWRGSIESVEYFGSWIYRIAVNDCLDAIRKRARTPQATDELDDYPVRAGLDPGLAMHVRSMVYADPAHELLLDCYVHGLTITQAALRHGIPEGTVKNRIHRARGRLRKAFGSRH